ncbi:dihydroxyacetone kinase subunit L [Sporolactobacillus shoreae]|uniref:phosphoenolpyruvate--glycerone phosphotransferase n=1 Tax=Sporolactobacillus shoreae TaxID=1465501 RepID=A0A4Z0GNC8_9BACL|nr:dihydroxyacetone kinase subunit DhaL [Sporolactobacillus shoreae]TGA98085.1 dihydroxyacetone kinase subunit L [Sporolactobacillus shoreae]
MLTVESTIKWLNLFSEKVEKNKDYLSELDQAIGDGDHGANMARGVAAMNEALSNKSFDSIQDVLKTAAMALLSKIGGASGPLYGSALIAMAKQAGEDRSDLASIIQAGSDGIQKRGKAEPGDKTMVDVWVPVVNALKNNKLSADIIKKAVQDTEPLKAKKGRASYLGDRSIGHIDPGSMSSGYLFETLIEGDTL